MVLSSMVLVTVVILHKCLSALLFQSAGSARHHPHLTQVTTVFPSPAQCLQDRCAERLPRGWVSTHSLTASQVCSELPLRCMDATHFLIFQMNLRKIPHASPPL